MRRQWQGYIPVSASSTTLDAVLGSSALEEQKVLVKQRIYRSRVPLNEPTTTWWLTSDQFLEYAKHIYASASKKTLLPLRAKRPLYTQAISRAKLECLIKVKRQRAEHRTAGLNPSIDTQPLDTSLDLA